MADVNPNLANMPKDYLFVDIGKRVLANKEKTKKEPFKLGIGDTTLSLVPTVVEAIVEKVKAFGGEGYSGYADNSFGDPNLRQALSEYYAKKFGVSIKPSEVFVNDGAKPATAQLPFLLNTRAVAVEDPAYPAYISANMMMGRKIVYLPCTKENGYKPDFPKEKVDIIYICRPNNPIGVIGERDWLTYMVKRAIETGTLIIYDVAYMAFIRTPGAVRSIYEIEDAWRCAIEVGSYSKWAGFTGVRLGWVIVPEALVVEDTKPGELNNLWGKYLNVYSNGPSKIVEAGGMAVLTEQGQKECGELVSYYLDTSDYLTGELRDMDIPVVGGYDSPFMFADLSQIISPDSWESFQWFLDVCNGVATPGVGFGPSGAGWLRFSALGKRDDAVAAMAALRANLPRL